MSDVSEKLVMKVDGVAIGVSCKVITRSQSADPRQTAQGGYGITIR